MANNTLMAVAIVCNSLIDAGIIGAAIYLTATASGWWMFLLLLIFVSGHTVKHIHKNAE